MGTLNVVITEIILCLVVAWVLGFLAAWIMHKISRKSYELEIEALEENLAYSSACNKNQEREITQQTLKIQEYKNLLDQNIDTIDGNTKSTKSKTKQKKERDILKLIDDNLPRGNKK